MGEFELLARIRERLARAGLDVGSALVLGSGDDAAITVPSGAAATTIDAFVEGVHFRRETADLRGVGRKAVAATLSDLAAMGAEPGEIYVALGVPEDLGEEECLELLDGMIGAAAEAGAVLAGGDLSRAPSLLLALSAVGYAAGPERLVRRGGARPGDLVAVTGELGGAAAGLLLLERPELAEALPAEIAARLRGRQLEPVARIAAGRALAEAGASAMIDLSDGLGGDAGHVGRASEARLGIELGRLPIQPGVELVAAAAGLDALELALSAGEDYELLACLPEDAWESAAAAVGETGVALSAIGAVERGDPGVELRGRDGSTRHAEGYDQLRRPSSGAPR